jgi:uncharacterized protein
MKQFLRIVAYLFVLHGFSSAHAGAYEDYFRAVAVDNARGVQALLQRGFDPNAPDEKGQTGLFIAVRDANWSVAELLLNQPGIQPDQPNASDETPLMMAALRGHADWVRKLLARGAAVNRPGWTPLHYAATGPDTEIVRLLLARGADIEAGSPNGTTPLMMAARYGAEGSALLLQQQGASTQVRNQKDMNAADFARSAGRESLARRLETAAK